MTRALLFITNCPEFLGTGEVKSGVVFPEHANLGEDMHWGCGTGEETRASASAVQRALHPFSPLPVGGEGSVSLEGHLQKRHSIFERVPGPFMYSWRVSTQFVLTFVKSCLLPPHIHIHTFFLCRSQGSNSRDRYLGGRALTNSKSDNKFHRLENKNYFRPVLVHGMAGGKWSSTDGLQGQHSSPSSFSRQYTAGDHLCFFNWLAIWLEFGVRNGQVLTPLKLLMRFSLNEPPWKGKIWVSFGSEYCPVYSICSRSITGTSGYSGSPLSNRTLCSVGNTPYLCGLVG